jgi:hypothetical protein
MNYVDPSVDTLVGKKRKGYAGQFLSRAICEVDKKGQTYAIDITGDKMGLGVGEDQSARSIRFTEIKERRNYE